MTRLCARALAGLLAITLALPGCNRNNAATTSGAPRVAFVMKTLNHPFFLDMQRGRAEAAQSAGVELVVQAAEREIDVEKQRQSIENLLQTAIKATCVTPSASREI